MKSINIIGSRLVKNRVGVTIVEALIALGIIVIGSLATASFFIHQNRMTADVSRQANCRATVEAQIAYFRQQGTTPHAMSWTHPSDPGSPSSLVDSPKPLMTNFQDPWLDDSIRRTPYWTSDLLADSTPNTIRKLYSAYLQRSALGTLATLYHQYPAVCTTPPPGVLVTDIPVPTSGPAPFPFMPQPDSSLRNFTSTLQIEPYNIDTGIVLAGCPTDMWPRPKGVTDATAANIIQFPPETRSDIGFRVTATGTYEDASGRNMTCIAKEDFSFPLDYGVIAPSVILNISDISAQNADGRSHPNCTLTPNKPSTLRLEIGFQSAMFEPGSVFLCRDMSEQLNPNYCPGAAGAEARNQLTTPKAPLANPGEWVPCDKVTACGVAPATSTATTFPGGQIKYINDYSTPNAGTRPEGLYGCDIRVDVATVDMAGNFVKLSDRARPDGLAEIIAEKYYDLPECWACFKKKKRSLGSFIISTILIGPIVSCLAGVGGVCRSSKGLRFIGNRCRNESGGRIVCKPINEVKPKWVPPGAGNCPAETAPWPTPVNPIPLPATPITYTLPATTNGSYSQADPYWDPANGILCEAEAVCQSGSFVGVEDEFGALVKTTCNRLYTVKRVDISSGTPTPSGGLCVVQVPIGPGTAAPPSANSPSYYSGYSVCSPGITGYGSNLLCVPNYDPVTMTYSPTYPPDPLTGASITNPGGYLYYEPVTTTPIDPTLPACEEL